MRSAGKKNSYFTRSDDLERLRRDLPHIFQSCTFNRSVTSPIELVTIGHFDEQMKATTESVDILQKADERTKSSQLLNEDNSCHVISLNVF